MNEPPLQVLGLPADADARAIKLAYARLLKTTRPDQDAAGFQRLNQAYRSALASCQPSPASAAVATSAPVATPVAKLDTPTMATRPVTTVPDATEPPPLPRFDGEAFVQALYQQLAGPAQPATLRQWLGQQPALWSLQLKQTMARPLLQRIADQQPPIAAECFDELLRFFDLDQISARIDPLWLARLRRRLHLRWLLLAEHRQALLQQLGKGVDRASTDRLLAQLQQPLSRRQQIMLALPPWGPGRVQRLLDALSQGHRDELPAAPFPPTQLAYWQQLAAPSLNGARLQLWLLRGGLGLFGAALLVAAMQWLGERSEGGLQATLMVFSVMLAVGACATAVWRSLKFLVPPLLAYPARWLAGQAVRFRVAIWIWPALLSLLALTLNGLKWPGLASLAAVIGLLGATRQLSQTLPPAVNSSGLLRMGYIALMLGSLMLSGSRWEGYRGAALALLGLAVWAIAWWRSNRARQAAR